MKKTRNIPGAPSTDFHGDLYRVPELSPSPFVQLDPPPGGLSLLRERLARHGRVHRHWATTRRGALAMAVTCAAVVLLLVFTVLLPRHHTTEVWLVPAPQYHTALATPLIAPDHPAWAALEMAESPTQSVVVPAAARNQTFVQRVPLDNDSVEIYLVASIQPDL